MRVYAGIHVGEWSCRGYLCKKVKIYKTEQKITRRQRSCKLMQKLKFNQKVDGGDLLV